jgi:hypothetical protein
LVARGSIGDSQTEKTGKFVEVLEVRVVWDPRDLQIHNVPVLVDSELRALFLEGQSSRTISEREVVKVVEVGGEERPEIHEDAKRER